MWTLYVKQTTRVSLIRDTERRLQLERHLQLQHHAPHAGPSYCLASSRRCTARATRIFLDDRGLSGTVGFQVTLVSDAIFLELTYFFLETAGALSELHGVDDGVGATL